MTKPNKAEQKLIEACVQGYLSKDWETLSAAELLTRAQHARENAIIHPPSAQWYLTQAEYLTEASNHVQ